RLRDPGAGVGPRISRAALRGALHRRSAARRGGAPLEADTRVRRATLQRNPLRLARRAPGLHSSRLPARHRELPGGGVAAAHARALPTSIIAPWKPTASTPSKTPFATWASGQPSCGGIFDYDAKKSRLVEVSRALEDPGVWTDAKRAQDLGKERSTLDATVSQLESIDVGLRDSGELFSLARGESDHDTLESLAGDVAGIERRVAELEFRRMFSDPMDPNSCFVDLNAGQGGTEAQDWCSMLLRMYLKYCDKKGFRAELLEESAGEVAGLKSASIKISGAYAFGHLSTENGIHRLVRK